jgi:hypothetical protein
MPDCGVGGWPRLTVSPVGIVSHACTYKTGTEQESVVAGKEVKPNPARKEQGEIRKENLAYQRKQRRSDSLCYA